MKYCLCIFVLWCFLGCQTKQKEEVALDRLKEKKELIFSKVFPRNQKRLKYYNDFNSGYLSNAWRKETTKENKFFIDTLSLQGRFDDGFLSTEMNATGVNGKAKRAEYGITLFDSIGKRKFLSFSFKIPKGFQYDSINLGRETMISQWHSKPGPGKDWDHYRKYNKYNRPSIALYITTNDNINFYALLRYGNNGKQNFEHKNDVWSTVALKKVEINQWIDIAFEIKWSFNNDGYLASWLNNEPFTPFNGLHNKVYGANMHNKSPTYFKFGQYRYFDDTNKHIIWFDELRVGDNLEEVSLFEELPEMFQSAKNLEFVLNHK